MVAITDENDRFYDMELIERVRRGLYNLIKEPRVIRADTPRRSASPRNAPQRR